MKLVYTLGKNQESKNSGEFPEVFKSNNGFLSDVSEWVKISYLTGYLNGFPIIFFKKVAEEIIKEWLMRSPSCLLFLSCI